MLSINRREIKPREKDANAILYGSCGTGKTTIIKADIKEILSASKDKVYVFTTENLLREYDDIPEKENFFLFSHNALQNEAVWKQFFRDRTLESEPIWIFIDNGDNIEEELYSKIEQLFLLARGYHLIVTLAAYAFDEQIRKIASNASIQVFLKLPAYGLTCFPLSYLSADEQAYIRRAQAGRPVLVKMFEEGKFTVKLQSDLEEELLYTKQ